MPTTKIISNDNSSRVLVEHLIMYKQKGVCRLCKQSFSKQHEIVSHGQKRKWYYHRHCARKI